uniref:Dbuz\Mdp n=3 Tax=Drosophila buzzatii TaxID=7264 RepID=Q4VIU9_DROBU|nr:Dbuz\Mdp [Drosophila buzzatii]
MEARSKQYFNDWMKAKKRCRRSRKIEKEWTPDDVHLLIRLVGQRELLWDPSNANHKDGKLREEAFKIIASTLDRTLTDCKAKWDNLRAQYRSYQAKESQNIEIKWQYYESLQFLHQVCDPRKSKGYSFELNDEVSIKRAPSQPLMEDLDTCSTLLSFATKAHEEQRRSLTVREPNPHSHHIFGEFVADEMSRLQPHIADKLKRNILKLIVEALDKQ